MHLEEAKQHFEAVRKDPQLKLPEIGASSFLPTVSPNPAAHDQTARLEAGGSVRREDTASSGGIPKRSRPQL